jgi:hypothetical protein
MLLGILGGRPSQQWREICALQTVNRDSKRVVAGILRGSPCEQLLVPGAALEASPRPGATCGWAWLADLFSFSVGLDYLHGMIADGCRRGGPLNLRDAIWLAQYWVTVVAIFEDLVVGTARGDRVYGTVSTVLTLPVHTRSAESGVRAGDRVYGTVRSGRVALVLEHQHWSVRRIFAAQLERCAFPTYTQLRWIGWGVQAMRRGAWRLKMGPSETRPFRPPRPWTPSPWKSPRPCGRACRTASGQAGGQASGRGPTSIEHEPSDPHSSIIVMSKDQAVVGAWRRMARTRRWHVVLENWPQKPSPPSCPRPQAIDSFALTQSEVTAMG